MSRLKIALVSPYDYPYPGGVTEHIAHLAARLTRRGHVVRILAPSSSDEESVTGDHVYRLGSIVRIPYHGAMARITLSPGLGPKVRTIFEREQFDVVHLHEPLLPALPLTVLAWSRSVNVGTFHAFWDRSLLYAVGRPFLRPAFERLNARIAVSEAARGYVTRYFRSTYEIIPNGVDTDVFRPDLVPLQQAQGDGPSVLFVGRLEQRKGFIHLLRAFASVSRTVPDARLLVVGPSSIAERQHFADLAERIGVARVSFLGPLTRTELARCYASADIYCAPSTGGESFGIVLLEAMACGRAVVCSDIPGYREVVSDGQQGLLVPPCDETALADALVTLLADPDQRSRLGELGRLRAARFDWELVTARVEALYVRALASFGRTESGSR